MSTESGGLESRIRKHIAPQIKDFFQPRSNNIKPSSIVSFVGNGLTRIASTLSGKGQLSWYEWCQGALDDAGIEMDLSYLQRIGYDLANIVGMAVEKADNAKRPEIFRRLYNFLYHDSPQIRPTIIHTALIRCCHDTCIVTTNYDDLLEEAAGASPYVLATRVARNKLDTEAIGENDPSRWSGPPILKIHGTMPRNVVFESWWRDHQSGAKVIATRESYEAALHTSEDKFREIYKIVHNRFKPSNIFLFLGMGFAGEELLMSRLLLGHSMPLALTLAVSSELDPLWNYRRFGITPITIPLGLASSSWARGLAMLVLLDEIIGYLHITDDVKDHLRDGWSEAMVKANSGDRRLILPGHGWEQKDVTDASVRDSSPVIVAVGNTQLNTVVGIDNAMAQESAYAPKISSLAPDEKDKDWLMTVEVGGQALVPVLVWDALRVPSALISRVYDDSDGSFILDRLSRTTWIDFTGVQQKSSRIAEKESGAGASEYQQSPLPKSKMTLTERMTVVTWYGLRTLVDWRREFSYKISLDVINKCRPPFIYLTKVNEDQIRRELLSLDGSDYDPILVLETGGWCRNMALVQFVSERRGIIIASAKSALGWMLSPIFPNLSDTDRWLVDWEQKYNREEEPKDDRGRLYQNYRFLQQLKQKRSSFLDHPVFRDLRTFVVTLGELGSIHWTKTADAKWSEPKWCASSYFHRIANSTDINGPEPMLPHALPLREIRSGLQCGDVARAGFVASLLISTGFGMRKELTTNDIDYAIAWLNWFGMQKLRFFTLEGFLRFLSTDAAAFVSRRLGNRQGSQVPQELEFSDAPDMAPFRFMIESALDNAGLHSALAIWAAVAQQCIPDSKELQQTRALWQKQIDRWKKERPLD